MTPTPDTVTEAIAFLASEGYVEDFQICAGGLVDAGTGAKHPVVTVTVDYAFRFEGPSDPGDEAVVLGVRCANWTRKGVVVSAYGPDAEPETAALLVTLTTSREH